MNYRYLELRCKCGETPSRFEEVGLTEDHQLVIHWWCSQCQRVVYLSKPLAECWRECPSREEYSVVATAPRETEYGPEDAKFLQRLGVRLA